MIKKSSDDSDGFKRWADDIRRRLIPKMRGSETVLMLAPDLEADFDVQFAVQIGAAILLEKPLILVVHTGRVIPPKLRAIADKVIDVDLDGITMSDTEVQNAIRQAMNDLGRQ